MEAMERKPSKITENTLFPLSIMLLIMGGVFWLTMMYAQTVENSRQIVEITRRQDAYNDSLQKISSDLSEIKGALGMKKMRHQDE